MNIMKNPFKDLFKKKNKEEGVAPKPGNSETKKSGLVVHDSEGAKDINGKII